MKVSRNLRIAATIVLMAAWIVLTIVSVQAIEVLTLNQAVENEQVLVTLKSKTRGFLGDTVTIVVTNRLGEDIQITARKDTLYNKNTGNQNLVVMRTLVLRVPAGQTREARGIWTACIDRHKGSPDEGNVFDIGPNIEEWDNDAARKLSRLLDVIEERELWDSSAAQDAVWKVTDNDPAEQGRELLEAAGIDPDEDITDFPHLETLYSHIPGTVIVPLLQTGDVQVTLRWRGNVDLDLYVTDPNGITTIYHGNMTPDDSVGRMDRDANLACDGSGWFTDEFLENIFWPADQAPLGEYTVEVYYFKDCQNVGKTNWQVTTLVDGQEESYTGSISRVGETIVVTKITRE